MTPVSELPVRAPRARAHGIEHRYDVPFIAALAFREKQIQQNYRPIIAVHKWFARRPGTLFRGLLLAEFGDRSLRDSFYESNDFSGRQVADPFMGGGTPLLEANRIGCNVIGFDINPMSYWIVREELENIDLAEYRRCAGKLTGWLEGQVGHLYRTRCGSCRSAEASVKYFFWVKVQTCVQCGQDSDLFPGYLLAEDRRHPRNVLVCASCGDLCEVDDRRKPGKCPGCGAALRVAGNALRNRFGCSHCSAPNQFPNPRAGAPRHRMFGIEYHCSACKTGHVGRFFKRPDAEDLTRSSEAAGRWEKTRAMYVPDDAIPSGDETDRLHRWGYRRYREMFNERQLLGLELSCRAIAKQSDERVRRALATNLSDLLRYQNMLCRYDTMALKSLDIFSVHGFPVSLVECESNFLGIANGSSGASVGSGGWRNIIEKYARAKLYCDHPFEIREDGSAKTIVNVPGEWIGGAGDRRSDGRGREISLHCASATEADLRPQSLDAVFTDPPYYGNVQYAELMDFCYVWLKKLAGDGESAFSRASTRNPQELTRNDNMGRALAHFADGLSQVFRRMAEALKPGAPLAFTYHHNSLEAYVPVGVAILDSGLTCSASLPCPAEMAGSIHIKNTGSSIVDTVFVCRTTGFVPRTWIADTSAELAQQVQRDLVDLRQAGLVPTTGDIRCLLHGHLVRMAIWRLRKTWKRESPIEVRLRLFQTSLEALGGTAAAQRMLQDELVVAPKKQDGVVPMDEWSVRKLNGKVSF